MPFEPIIPNGQRLGNSHTDAGAVTGHLFDIETGELKGHASWRWVDDTDSDFESIGPTATSDDDEVATTVADLIVLGIIAAAILATPMVVRWWRRRFIPFAKAKWRRILGRDEAAAVTGAGAAEVGGRRTAGNAAGGGERAIPGTKYSMSSAEWEARLRAMLAAAEFENEQLRILAAARIQDPGLATLGYGTDAKLTEAQFVARLKLALKSNPITLDDETSTALMRTFGTPIEAIAPSRRRQLE